MVWTPAFRSMYADNRSIAFQRTQRARDLRVHASPPERILWSRLRARRCGGFKFRRQHPIGPYIADFYCHDARLVIEIDGMTHDNRIAYDRQRDRYMRARGLDLMRYPARSIAVNLDGVVQGILNRCLASRKQDSQ